MGQVVAAQVADGQLPEDEVDEAGAQLDGVTASHHATGLEAGEQEGVAELFQRHPVLEAHAHGDGEAVEHGPEGGALLVDVEEDLAKAAVLVLARAEVELGATDGGGLRVATAAVG